MKYGVNELRRMYLDFFESKGHLKMKSFSLVPHNDDSLLLINAGMAPLKPYFTGQEIPPRRRVTTCQKCVRTGDIENVGKTARHLTFFEMLGNFSFGDYFKREAIHWSWEFLTEILKLDPQRLYVTIFENDDEAFNIWNKEIGVPAEKIYRIGRDADGSSDNFWEHGAGPCGPCTEIYYDRGPQHGNGPEDVMGGEGDRFMEVWNNVFTQFYNDGKGNYSELKQKNIDTGMGLERLAVVMQDVDSVFDVDTMKAIRDAVCALSGKTYETDDKDDVSIRLIIDHIRSTTFMISDGILPSNEGRGYVLRRLIRRAARHGRMLGIKGEFMGKLADVVIRESHDGYPELLEKQEFIRRVLTEEERKFNATIDQGLEILSELEDDLAKKGEKVLNGKDAFRLYDTYGFPVDLTNEILEERGFSVDMDGFKASMEEQKEKARAARKTSNYMGKAATVYDDIDKTLTTEFVGYDKLHCEANITAMTTEVNPDAGKYGELTDVLQNGEKGTIITDVTPFYGTMGGQVGDTGEIRTDNGCFTVTDTIHLLGGRIGHVGYVSDGFISAKEPVEMSVDQNRRNLICRNHSATHLLQRALRDVLGTHVQQAGSYQDDKELRFDFTHFSALTPEELSKVERLVNKRIRAGVDVVTDVMSLEDAKKTGAMALFGEKYGDKVRVVKMGDYSTELCGGTHVKNTADIGAIKILSEAGVSSGVRRITALTSDNILNYYSQMEQQLNEILGALKTPLNGALAKVESLQNEIKSLKRENDSLKSAAAKESLGDINSDVTDINGVKFYAKALKGVGGNDLRNLGDQIKDKLGDGVIFLASDNGEKVALLSMATDSAVKKGVHAGNLIKAVASIVGGGGGGRPQMAQAGGKDATKIPDAISKAQEVVKEQLS
ncbi:MAG: alanine--tRNA ligase [Lachnospiraceae bacterium]|uniref:Alanine--tRNA ligase n=1 Tax=Candidatus Weimeria bifida TaxID=2599074 RepID=A0A6N7J241_9FIRM|nr:alanine--tRNA ligase [Candidatus Weimeria bifida]RRF95977.1 MAG: alanine--tRNA ligase [Lachnospiraceae bacterium]